MIKTAKNFHKFRKNKEGKKKFSNNKEKIFPENFYTRTTNDFYKESSKAEGGS